MKTVYNIKKWNLVMMGLFLSAFWGHVALAQETSINGTLPETGLWTTKEEDGVFRIYACGQDLCGNFVGMKYKGNTPPMTTHGRSQCDFPMLRNLVRQKDGKVWTGKIADPRDEKLYDAKVWMKNQKELNLRGYMGISLFGETKTWHRFTGKIGEACHLE